MDELVENGGAINAMVDDICGREEREEILDIVFGWPLVKGELCTICAEPILTKEETYAYKPWMHGWQHKKCIEREPQPPKSVQTIYDMLAVPKTDAFEKGYQEAMEDANWAVHKAAGDMIARGYSHATATDMEKMILELLRGEKHEA